MIKHVKNVRFAIAKLAFWHEALLCGIGHQNGWKQISSVLSAYKVVIFSGGYSCKSPYKCSTDTLRWYATYVETSHFTLCFHKQNKGSLILHGICTIFECCLEVRNPDSQHVFCSPPARWGLLDFIRAHARLLLRLLLLLDYLSSSPPPLPPPLPPCSTSTSALPTLPTRRQALRQLPSSVCTAGPQRPDRMPEDMPDKMPWDMPDRMPEDMPDRMPQDMPDRIPEDFPDKMPEDMPDRMPDRMPEDMSDRMPEDMPDSMPEDMPDRMPEDMPEVMPDRMPDSMPEDMSDRMPEDLPVRKCINVMVGITRSKVFFYLSCMCFHCIFPIETHVWLIFPWYFPYGFKILFLFRHLCSWRGFFCGNLWYDQWYCYWSLTVRMHVASFVHSNGSSLFTIIHWPWSMNQRLPVLIQVISINHHQVSVNYFCYHHWTIIKINQVIDEPEIIQCLILQLPAFNTSCHMPRCHFDEKILHER